MNSARKFLKKLKIIRSTQNRGTRPASSSDNSSTPLLIADDSETPVKKTKPAKKQRTSNKSTDNFEHTSPTTSPSNSQTSLTTPNLHLSNKQELNSGNSAVLADISINEDLRTKDFNNVELDSAVQNKSVPCKPVSPKESDFSSKTDENVVALEKVSSGSAVIYKTSISYRTGDEVIFEINTSTTSPLTVLQTTVSTLNITQNSKSALNFTCPEIVSNENFKSQRANNLDKKTFSIPDNNTQKPEYSTKIPENCIKLGLDPGTSKASTSAFPENNSSLNESKIVSNKITETLEAINPSSAISEIVSDECNQKFLKKNSNLIESKIDSDIDYQASAEITPSSVTSKMVLDKTTQFPEENPNFTPSKIFKDTSTQTDTQINPSSEISKNASESTETFSEENTNLVASKIDPDVPTQSSIEINPSSSTSETVSKLNQTVPEIDPNLNTCSNKSMPAVRLCTSEIVPYPEDAFLFIMNELNTFCEADIKIKRTPRASVSEEFRNKYPNNEFLFVVVVEQLQTSEEDQATLMESMEEYFSELKNKSTCSLPMAMGVENYETLEDTSVQSPDSLGSLPEENIDDTVEENPNVDAEPDTGSTTFRWMKPRHVRELLTRSKCLELQLNKLYSLITKTESFYHFITVHFEVPETEEDMIYFHEFLSNVQCLKQSIILMRKFLKENQTKNARCIIDQVNALVDEVCAKFQKLTRDCIQFSKQLNNVLRNEMERCAKVKSYVKEFNNLVKEVEEKCQKFSMRCGSLKEANNKFMEKTAVKGDDKDE
ncbi:hypothetical protein C0J52_23648 [Blattella germanica]|nr:hypothetical protein C0J52_23648 [Blattella germanica]